MPGLNQTGPMGQGPMTGRRMGRCTNFGASFRNSDGAKENTNGNLPEDFYGRGFGYGRGRCGRGLGMGRRRGGYGRGMGFQNRFRSGF